MGIDVGVVRIDYLARPREPVYHFLYDLAERRCGDSWGGGWNGNTFVEMTKRRMLSMARAYAKRKSLTSMELEEVVSWVKALAWDGDTIMLHLNW